MSGLFDYPQDHQRKKRVCSFYNEYMYLLVCIQFCILEFSRRWYKDEKGKLERMHKGTRRSLRNLPTQIIIFIRKVSITHIDKILICIKNYRFVTLIYRIYIPLFFSFYYHLFFFLFISFFTSGVVNIVFVLIVCFEFRTN